MDLKQRGRQRERRWLRKIIVLVYSLPFCVGELGFVFFALNLVINEMFFYEANQIGKTRVPRTLKKDFSRCNFSDNYVQLLSSMHSSF